MTLRKFFGEVNDKFGNAVPGATVTVKITETSTLADLYEDDEVTVLSNPVLSDQMGSYSFNVTPGIYDLYIVATGITTVLTKVQMDIIPTGVLPHREIAFGSSVNDMTSSVGLTYNAENEILVIGRTNPSFLPSLYIASSMAAAGMPYWVMFEMHMIDHDDIAVPIDFVKFFGWKYPSEGSESVKFRIDREGDAKPRNVDYKWPSACALGLFACSADGTITIRPRNKVFELTDAATIAVDASLGEVADVTLGGDRTMGAPSNPVDGQGLMFRIKQDGTGGRTLAWDAVYRFTADIPTHVMTTTIGKMDRVAFQYNSSATKWDVVAISKGY